MEVKKMLTLKNGTVAFDSQELINAVKNDPKVLDIALEDTATAYAEMTDGDVDGWVKFMREFVTSNTNAKNEMGGEAMLNNIRICEDCGRIIGDGEDYIIDGYDRIICEDCRLSMYYCEDCDNYYNEEDMIAIFDRYGDVVQFVCTVCAETYYSQCPECGRWYLNSAFDGNGACVCCTPEVILSYHSGNPNGLKFHGSPEYSFINGYIGGELEITDLDNRAAADILEACGSYDFCHFENDCSVDGAEIIFQPRTIESWEAARPAVNSMYDILTEHNCTSEGGNGFHVHISRTAFGSTNEEQANAIAKFMRLFSDDNFLRCCEIAGCSNQDARDWARNCNEYTKEEQKRIAERCGGNRYIAVNVTNRHTVEVRLGRSTMDVDRFYGWLHFIAAMVRRTETITMKEADDFNEWMYKAPADVMELVTRAGVYFTEPLRPIPTDRYNEIIKLLSRNLVYIEETVTGQCANRYEILKRIVNLTDNEARVLGFK